MADKLVFYSDYGAEEFYVYDPDTNEFAVYLRGTASLRRINTVDGFVSPRMGIRFDLSGEELVLRHADGKPFLTFEELEADREELRVERDVASRRAETAEHRFRRLAELVRKQASQQATPEELAELQRLLLEPSPRAD